MSVTIKIKVSDLATVLANYNQIKVYRSATGEDGTFSEITDALTRITITAEDSLYSYTDSTGTVDYYYKASYYNSTLVTESDLSGTIHGDPTPQLVDNMQVVITLDKSIANTDGISLGEDYEFYFTTTYNPMYSSIRRIKLDIGKFIEGIPDDTINLAIFEASRDADGIALITDPTQQTTLFAHARRQWTTCRAEEILLGNAYNMSGGMLKSKRLGDFEVVYDKGLINDINKRIADCLARWEAEVTSGGKAVQTPAGVIKGEWDPDRPDIGRDWLPDDGWPAANAKIKFPYNRRFLSFFLPGRIRRRRR